MATQKDLTAIREAFVAEFGQHAAENTETGRLLGLAPSEDEA
jgi:hypothetical protein